jgi:hypothetical protein
MDKHKAENDLAFIKGVIEESRTVLVENGLRFILWGALAIVCTFLTYGAEYLRLYCFIPWIWVFFVVAGIAAVFLVGWRQRGKSARTFAGTIYAFVWIGTVLFIAIVVACMLLLGVYSLRFILSVTAGGLGTAYFISSTIIRNRWMFALSFVWWAGIAPILIVDPYYAPLVLAGLVGGCELVPGIVLYARSKKSGRAFPESGRAEGAGRTDE